MKLNHAIMSQIADTTYTGPLHEPKSIPRVKISRLCLLGWAVGTFMIILLALAVFGII